VEGNLIGTDRDGMHARGNEIGVVVDDSESGVVPVDGRIGGTRSGQRNVISGNTVHACRAPCTASAAVSLLRQWDSEAGVGRAAGATVEARPEPAATLRH
jgi:hypothetical protein